MIKKNTQVKVKSFDKIIRTLDNEGCLDNLPFMPEMKQYCGQTFSVSMKVEKTCVDNPVMFMAEFVKNDVYFLNDLRCTGEFHDGCQRSCRIFWKADWLEITDQQEDDSVQSDNYCDSANLLKSKSNDQTYFCQSTQLRSSTIPLSMRDKIVKIWTDLKIGTYNLIETLRLLLLPFIKKIMRKFDLVYPKGLLLKTPIEQLNFKEGDLVEVRPYEEITQTLDRNGKNKGLIFEPEMKLLCGKKFKVRNRLDKMILERNGKMIDVKNTVILEGVTCDCIFTFGGCPRKEFQFWREIWLRKA